MSHHALLSTFAALTVIVCSTVSNAHDIYSDLRKSNGQSCCDGTDCRPARYRNGRFGDRDVRPAALDRYSTVRHRIPSLARRYG